MAFGNGPSLMTRRSSGKTPRSLPATQGSQRHVSEVRSGPDCETTYGDGSRVIE